MGLLRLVMPLEIEIVTLLLLQEAITKAIKSVAKSRKLGLKKCVCASCLINIDEAVN